MTTLWLVRHGRPAMDPSLPARMWPLAPDTGAVAALRDHLPAVAAWCSSPERKAWGTARRLTDGEVNVVDDFREADRPAGWLEDPVAFNALVRRSVSVPDVPAADGWEPAGATRARVEAAARDLVDVHPDEDVVAVGHGTAWTLLVSALTSQPPDLDAWDAMRMPDLAVLDVPDHGPAVLRRTWGTTG